LAYFLHLVVYIRPPVAIRLEDQRVNILASLSLVHFDFAVWEQSHLQAADGLYVVFETRHVLVAHKHHLNQQDYLIRMFLKSHETSINKIDIENYNDGAYNFIRSLKSLNFLFFVPPITFTNSSVNLNGALSNLSPLPGALESKKP